MWLQLTLCLVTPGAMLRPTLANLVVDPVDGGSLDISWLAPTVDGGGIKH